MDNNVHDEHFAKETIELGETENRTPEQEKQYQTALEKICNFILSPIGALLDKTKS